MKGIDVASYQGVVPWHNLTDTSFGITKVTEGEQYTNPFWQTNAVNMRVEKKIRGFYLFSVPGLNHNTPEAEAAYFFGKVQNTLMTGDLIACDIEKSNYNNAAQTSDWALRLLTHLQYLAGYRPFLYSYPDFIKNFLTDRRLSQFPLWLAWYQDSLPKSFAQWTSIALWQKGPGTVRGENSKIDIDIFFLNANELKAYGKP